jgi:hypothetical protein
MVPLAILLPRSTDKRAVMRGEIVGKMILPPFVK